MTAIALALVQALIAGVPRILKLIRDGTSPSEIKLSDFISTDALADLKAAKDEAQAFIDS